MVAGEDKEVFRIVAVNEVDVLGDRVCGSAEHFEAGVGLFTGSEDEDAAVLGIKAPQAALRDIAVQKYGFVLGKDAYHVHAAVGAVAQGEIDDTVFAAVCHCRLRHLVGEIMQTTSPAAGQDHC